MAVVEEDVAGDADAEGYLGGWGYGYLDNGIELGRAGLIFAGASIVFVVFGLTIADDSSQELAA